MGGRELEDGGNRSGDEAWGGGRWWRGNPSPTLPWNVTGNERGGVDGLARGGVGRLGRRRRLTGGGGMSKTLTLAAAGGGGGEGFLKRRRGAERNGDGSGWGKRSVEGKVVDDDWTGVIDSRWVAAGVDEGWARVRRGRRWVYLSVAGLGTCGEERLAGIWARVCTDGWS
jgi:hypothetical protein